MSKVIERIKAQQAVCEISDERSSDDGVWVYLKSGFCHPWQQGLHCIHEDTPHECMSFLSNVHECHCNDCKHDRDAAKREVKSVVYECELGQWDCDYRTEIDGIRHLFVCDEGLEFFFEVPTGADRIWVEFHNDQKCQRSYKFMVRHRMMQLILRDGSSKYEAVYTQFLKAAWRAQESGMDRVRVFYESTCEPTRD